MPRFCAACGGQMADNATACPACGKAAGQSAGGGAAAAPAAAGGGLADNVAGMLAYFTLLPAIIFLVMDPYKNSKFVRFHAFQNICFNVAWVAAWIGMMMASVVLAFIPVLGHLLVLLLWATIMLGGFVLWVMAVIKANQGQKWQMPVLGKF